MDKNIRFGLFCSNKNQTLSTNRTCRLSSLSKEKILEITKLNLQDFDKLIDFCIESQIYMFRLGNSIIPFASHEDFDLNWWDEILPFFEKVKHKQSQKIRITIHPGQFIQLGSKNQKVVANSLRELQYCHKILDLLGDDNSIITLHIGGTNGNKNETMDRFVEVFMQNKWLGKYLALENDEYNFNACQTLDVAKECNIGMIFDIFHHSINPSDISWGDIKSSWTKRPKVHISSQGEGKIGTHSQFINPEDFANLKCFLGDDFFETDIMIEAKAKEDAILKLRKLTIN